MSKTFANEKGSATLFVVVAMLFFMLFLLTMYMNLSNKIMNKNAEIKKIQKNYEDKSMDEEYERIMNGYSIENLIPYTGGEMLNQADEEIKNDTMARIRKINQ